MLVFDIETLNYAGRNSIWQFGAYDGENKYNLINWTLVKKAENWINNNRNVNFFNQTQLVYAKNANAVRLGEVKFFQAIQKILNNHKVISAYNLNFDYKYLADNGVCFPSYQKKVCLWGSFVLAFVNHKYVKYCYDNEYLTEKGNIITNAEVAYKYLSGNEEYNHLHFALEDCEAEYFIWQKIKQRKQKLVSTTSFNMVKQRLKDLGY